MIIVTGGAGFIGSNLVKALNTRGHNDILVVDNLKRGEKFANLVELEISDYLDRDDFRQRIDDRQSLSSSVEAIFHQGACSTTTEWDGRYMLHNNFEYSKQLLHYCLVRKIPFIYASSAAVYGTGRAFREERRFEKPLNVYGYSKLLFDQYVRKHLHDAQIQIVGCRYFNVYGPGEQHKNEQASVVFHLRNQLLESDRVHLFSSWDGYGAGEQRRDFVHVSDAVSANLWFLEHPEKSGVFNIGTGISRSFNDLASCVLSYFGRGEIQYIPFPEHLKKRYQNFTEADLSMLRQSGYDAEFKTLEQGVHAYLSYLDESSTV